MKKLSLTFFLATILAGCGTVNNALVEKTKHVEYYRIFDIKTDLDRYEAAELASNGLGKNVNDTTEAHPIPTMAGLPENPGRFTLADPFKGSNLAMLAGGGGSLGFKIATCDGASWTSKATRKVSGSSKLNLTACLFPYKEGYHLNLYATFTKKEGGLMQLSRKAADALVGTPEEWTEKTFLDIVRNIQKSGKTEITYLEGYPRIQGTPWLDSGKEIKHASAK